jgi:RNA polymerase sigma-70 factor (ECF subfamily)
MRYDESTLLDRMLRGDEAAFEQFVDAYYPRLYRFAQARMSRNDAAQDVVQSTFQKVIPKLGTYRGEAALFSWLCTFCRFEIAAWYRAQSRIPPPVALVEDEPEVRAALESLAVLAEGPEEEAQRSELARLVRATLDHLPLRYADALESKYLRGLSVRELADRLGLTEKATESLLTRARIAFRDGFGAAAGGKRVPA